MIKTLKSEVQIIKELEFGFGDIDCVSISDNENGKVGLGYYQVEEGEIGRTIEKHPTKEDFYNKEVQVIMMFSNLESLDITIKNLNTIREKFL